MFHLPMKLEITNSVLIRNLMSSMTTDKDLEKIINNKNEVTSNIKYKGIGLELTVYLELKINNYTNETETHVMMEEDTEVKNEKKKNQNHTQKFQTGQLRL